MTPLCLGCGEAECHGNGGEGLVEQKHSSWQSGRRDRVQEGKREGERERQGKWEGRRERKKEDGRERRREGEGEKRERESSQEEWSFHRLPGLSLLPPLLYPGPQPIGWCCSHSGRVFHPQLLPHMSIISGRAPTDTPRSVLY
jgi:hypothetical protein